MLENIKRYLEKKNLKFWTIGYNEIKKEEIYTIFDNVESNRKVEVSEFFITIFVDHENYTGESSLSLPIDCSDEDMKKEIDRAINSALIVKNEKYEIKQEKINYPVNKIKKVNMNKFHEKVKNALKDIKEVKVSSSEKFIQHSHTKFINSVGNSYEEESIKLILDMVFLAGKNLESESQFLRKGFSLEELNLEETIKSYANYAVDTLKSSLPETGKYNVIFAEEALEEFFSFFTFHALGSSFYNSYSIFKKGERVFDKGDGDELNIYCDPLIENREIVADSLGFLNKKFYVIKDSVLENVVANTKYSQYLKIPFTGSLTNVVIEGGKHKCYDLVEENTIIVARVSAFEPKEMTGDFSGEIRLGYLYKKGQYLPIKGGSFAGNLRELMPNVNLSKEIIKMNSYIGPMSVKLYGVNIAGK